MRSQETTNALSVDAINNMHARSNLDVKHFRILQLLISVGLILSIAGGTTGSVSPDGKTKVSASSKAGTKLYVVAYVGLVVVCVVSMKDISYTLTGEKRIAAAVILACPSILIRLAYSALEVFVHNHEFNIIDGKVAILVVMVVLQEFVVVISTWFLGSILMYWIRECVGPTSLGHGNRAEGEAGR